MLRSGKRAARKLNHARILLLVDEGEHGPGWSDGRVAEALAVSKNTICRVRQRCVEEGPQAALLPKPSNRVYQRKLDGVGEAKLTQLACSSPPEGRNRWTLTLLADRLVALDYCESLSYEAVRQCLKKTSSSRG
jgi:hypothetical protein